MGRKKGKEARPDSRDPRGRDPDVAGPSLDPLLHGYPDARLDLHGRSRHEADVAVRNFVLTQSRLGPGRVVHVLTGKGTGRLFVHVGRLLETGLAAWVGDAVPDLQGAGYRVRLK